MQNRTAHLLWSSALELGHAQIDREHMRLVDILNRLCDATQDGRGRDACVRLVDELIACTREHFAAEEGLMARHGYAPAALHKGQHANLLQDLLDLRSRFEAGTAGPSEALLQSLKDWLTGHILQSDRALVGALNGRR
jgi:hemerythrin-like metal-binding protein